MLIKFEKYFFVILCICVQLLQAVHFLGGGLSAKFLGTSSGRVIMRFTQRLTWRNSMVSWTCDAVAQTRQWTFGGPANFTCVNQCYASPSETIGQYYSVCMSYSTVDDWGYGEFSWNNAISSSTSNYRIQWVDINWDTTLLSDGANSPWSIGLMLDTRVRADIGTINSSPYTIIPPLFKLRQGFVHQFLLPSSDPNNDNVRCRFGSSFFECGGICKVNGSSTELPANLTSECMFTFNGVGKKDGLYAVGVVFEDFASLKSTTPISSVPAQFLIKLVNVTGATCNLSPTLTTDRQESSCFAAPYNTTFTFTFVAKTACSNVNITSIQILGLKGNYVTNLTAVSGTTNQWSVTVYWFTMTSNSDNPNVVCGLATDSNFMIDLYCFTVLAGISAPSLNQSTIYPSGDITSLLSSNNSFLSWSASFDSSVIRAKKSAYINIYSSNGTLVLNYDASNSSIVSLLGNTINFNTTYNFPPGNYYILFDYGICLGTQFCNVASNPVTSTSFWTFSVVATTTTTTTPTTTTTTPTTTTTTTTTPTTTTTTTSTTTTTTTSTTTTTTSTTTTTTTTPTTTTTTTTPTTTTTTTTTPTTTTTSTTTTTTQTTTTTTTPTTTSTTTLTTIATTPTTTTTTLTTIATTPTTTTTTTTGSTTTSPTTAQVTIQSSSTTANLSNSSFTSPTTSMQTSFGQSTTARISNSSNYVTNANRQASGDESLSGDEIGIIVGVILGTAAICVAVLILYMTCKVKKRALVGVKDDDLLNEKPPIAPIDYDAVPKVILPEAIGNDFISTKRTSLVGEPKIILPEAIGASKGNKPIEFKDYLTKEPTIILPEAIGASKGDKPIEFKDYLTKEPTIILPEAIGASKGDKPIEFKDYLTKEPTIILPEAIGKSSHTTSALKNINSEPSIVLPNAIGKSDKPLSNNSSITLPGSKIGLVQSVTEISLDETKSTVPKLPPLDKSKRELSVVLPDTIDFSTDTSNEVENEPSDRVDYISHINKNLSIFKKA